MRKYVVLALGLLLLITIVAPAVAFAQEILPTPDMLAPIGLITFGIVGLGGGTAGYIWRHRPNR